MHKKLNRAKQLTSVNRPGNIIYMWFSNIIVTFSSNINSFILLLVLAILLWRCWKSVLKIICFLITYTAVIYTVKTQSTEKKNLSDFQGFPIFLQAFCYLAFLLKTKLKFCCFVNFLIQRNMLKAFTFRFS